MAFDRGVLAVFSHPSVLKQTQVARVLQEMAICSAVFPTSWRMSAFTRSKSTFISYPTGALSHPAVRRGHGGTRVMQAGSPSPNWVCTSGRPPYPCPGRTIRRPLWRAPPHLAVSQAPMFTSDFKGLVGL